MNKYLRSEMTLHEVEWNRLEKTLTTNTTLMTSMMELRQSRIRFKAGK